VVSLALLAALLSPPVVQAPCDAGIERSVAALLDAHPEGGAVRLAPDCTYHGTVRLATDRPVALLGDDGTRLEGRVVVEGSGPVTLRRLTVQGPVTPLVFRGQGALTLDEVTLRSRDDGLHVDGSGPVLLRDCDVEARSTAIWAEGAAAFRMVGGSLRAGEQALVVLRATGPVRVAGAHITVGPETIALAALRIQAEGPVEVAGNTFDHAPAPGIRGAVLLDMDAAGIVADNDFRTPSLPLRTHRPVTVGCNQFQSLARTVVGPNERVCERDLAPDRLDWRARVGGPDPAGCRLYPGSPPCPVMSAEATPKR
jgi:hypothetical protein